MSQAGTSCRHVLVVDDDVIMRELLTAILGIEGYEVKVAESGNAALALLASGAPVDVILLDLHMPGVQGAELAARLHEARAVETLLIGMSGSMPTPAERGSFRAFLDKPFTVEDFTAAIETAKARLDGATVTESVEKTSGVLNEEIYERLAAMLPPTQLRELYRITIEDVLRRVGLMRENLKLGRTEETRAEAHAIKGGCGMVGAGELSTLAAAVEGGSKPGNPPFANFDAACARLQGMLDARFRHNVEKAQRRTVQDAD